MSDMLTLSDPLKSLVTESSLADKAIVVGPTVIRVQFGSAFVLAGTAGTALVAVAPLFRRIPDRHVEGFYRRLLEYNARMAGMANFAVQPDGWVVIHAGRPLRGVDAHEFSMLVMGVGRYADQYDDVLNVEFYDGKGMNSSEAASA